MNKAEYSCATDLQWGKKKRKKHSPVRPELIMLNIYHFKAYWCTPYLTGLLKPYNPTSASRSTNQLLLDILRSRLWSRVFSVGAPNLWNNLPSYIRAAQCLYHLKTLWITYFFSLAFGSSWARNLIFHTKTALFTCFIWLLVCLISDCSIKCIFYIAFTALWLTEAVQIKLQK